MAQVTVVQSLLLVVQDGPEVGRVYPLNNALFSIGRQVTNNIVIKDSRASRLHARIELTPRGPIVIDNSSANGTWVNGVQIGAPQLLRPNDTVQVGGITFLLIENQPAPRPRPLVFQGQPPNPNQRPTNFAPPNYNQFNPPPPPQFQPQPRQPQPPLMPPNNNFNAPPPPNQLRPPMNNVAPPALALQPRPQSVQNRPQPGPVQVAPPQPVAKPGPELQPKTKLPLINRTTAPIPVKSAKAGPLFPNYMQVTPRVPMWVWHSLRVISVTLALVTGVLLFVRPDIGLSIFWKFFVPSLPVLFFVAPGLWRNICPMAALNQTPRLFKFTKALTLPKWFKEYSYVIGIVLLLVIIPTRRVVFNQTGWALGLVVFGALGTAFVMGLTFKGKSGWCSSICPLLPVQRIYGQTPYVKVRNSHCQPCVGCTKNCYDFNPQVAYLSDLNDDDPHYSGYRKFFIGLFPGFILGFYSVADINTAADIPGVYLQVALYAIVSLGIFNLITSLVKVSVHKITTLFAMAALNFYYWYNFPVLSNAIAGLFGQTAPDWLIWGLRGILLALSLAWIVRTYIKENRFLAQAVGQATPQIKVGSVKTLDDHAAASDGKPEVNFLAENKRCVVAAETSILDVAENNNLRIEAGCRMGVCGADPIAILKGQENLSPISDDEQSTLDRLGWAKNTRMACCARVRGPVSVALKPEEAKETPSSMIQFEYDKNIKQVVIIGNGVAGVTTADHIRRRHPDCTIHVIGREKHNLYNRMGIARLVYGRSAMQGLYLLPETWYDDHNITTWLNTQVTKVDPNAHQVFLATGEVLDYDKLVLAMGSRSTVPAVENFGIPGTFVLREAEDAMAIRAFAQDFGSKRAIVAGSGLLGLEAAYALLKLGLAVSVLERGERLLSKQLDARASQLLRDYLEGLGIKIVFKAETATVTGVADMTRMVERIPDRLKFGGSGQSDNRVTHIVLKDGRRLSCDVFLLATGITSNVELARAMGLKINKGVVIDDEMRTSLPDVLAAGDVAEFQGMIHGLWPVATEQAQVVATNAIGGHLKYQGSVPVTALKIVGVELTSVGQFEPKAPNDLVIALEDAAAQHYRKLVINNGKIVGAILLGYPLITSAVTSAIKKQYDVRPYINDLRAGNWEILSKLAG